MENIVPSYSTSHERCLQTCSEVVCYNSGIDQARYKWEAAACEESKPILRRKNKEENYCTVSRRKADKKYKNLTIRASMIFVCLSIYSCFKTKHVQTHECCEQSSSLKKKKKKKDLREILSQTLNQTQALI